VTDALVRRRKVAVRLLLLEASFLAGILGGFAVVSTWLAGGVVTEASLLAGLALLPTCLLANWLLVRSGWKHLDDDFGGGGGAL
jgi:hypothetical protein